MQYIDGERATVCLYPSLKNISKLSVLALIVCFLFVGAAYSEDKKESAVEGRVVGRDGRPLSGVTVVATLPDGEYHEGQDWFEVKTRPDGTFLLEGLYPGTYYKIICDGGQCNDQKERIRSLPSGETMKLKRDFVLTFSPFKVSPEGVIKDLWTGLEWAPVPLSTLNYESAARYARFLRLAGGGWRLPTVDELNGLYESGRRGCGLDLAFENYYPKVWASDQHSPSKKWVVRFSRYKVYTEVWDMQSDSCDDCRVLPVRSLKKR